MPGLAWTHPGPSDATTGIDWHRWLDGDRQIDPYLVWADLTRFAGVRPKDRDDADFDLPVLVEATLADQIVGDESKRLCAGVYPVFGVLSIPGAYLYAQDAGPAPSGASCRRQYVHRTATRFFTATINVCAIEMLLVSAEAIVRFQLGLPRVPQSSFRPPSRPGPVAPVAAITGNLTPRTVIGIVDDGCAFAHPSFLGGTFQSPECRVQYLWDQNDVDRNDWWKNRPLTTEPVCPETVGQSNRTYAELFGYGADIPGDLLQQALVQGSSSPLGPYQVINYAPMPLQPYLNGTGTMADAPPPDGNAVDGPRPIGTHRSKPHGTAVMHISAGVTSKDEGLAALRFGEQRRRVDTADQWKTVFVQLPTLTTIDTSGGSLGVHVLDAVRYVIARAEALTYATGPAPKPVTAQAGATGGPLTQTLSFTTEMFSAFRMLWRTFQQTNSNQAEDRWFKLAMAPHVDNSVVINVSYGAAAGAHDGTSIIEEALTELATLRNRLHIVASAGNLHRSKTHAHIDLEQGESNHFVWRVGPDNPAESFLEVWLPHHYLACDESKGAEPLPEGSLKRFLIAIHAPSGQVEQVCWGNVRLLREVGAGADTLAVAGVVFARRVVQGRNGTMVLLAVAPTRLATSGSVGPRLPGPHGEWIVEVSYLGSPGDGEGKGAKVRVHAWSERNDLLYGTMRRQQSTVVSDEPVPEQTEFMPTSLEQQARPACRVPWLAEPYLPAYSMGTLANAPLLSEGKRGPWVVGAYRRNDGEMSTYSSGGPSAMPAILGGKATNRRTGPDWDAPADESAAIRGIRAAGFLFGTVSRLSGSSAAAPTVTRFLANFGHLLLTGSTQSDIEEFFRESLEVPSRTSVLPLPGRPTPTPVTDDRYRKGRLRLK